MFYVVGLGNPGPKYALTRHNIGWLVLDTLCENELFAEPENNNRHQAVLRCGRVGKEMVCCVYPQTFMNKSGETVRSMLREDPEGILVVVHDDVALPLGTIRVSFGRGHGGHNGVRSIIDQYKSKEFCRVRIGVAPRKTGCAGIQKKIGPAESYVLKPFSWLERSIVSDIRKTAVSAVLSIIRDGCNEAMNTYNRSSESVS